VVVNLLLNPLLFFLKFFLGALMCLDNHAFLFLILSSILLSAINPDWAGNLNVEHLPK
jgi:hypothetical protein